MAALYAIAGCNHFISPKIYERIIPPYLPHAQWLVIASGAVEVLLAMALCVESLKSLALYGIALMLLAFLPVHFYMLASRKASMGLPKWLLLLRIPLQAVLISWALAYID